MTLQHALDVPKLVMQNRKLLRIKNTPYIPLLCRAAIELSEDVVVLVEVRALSRLTELLSNKIDRGIIRTYLFSLD